MNILKKLEYKTYIGTIAFCAYIFILCLNYALISVLKRGFYDIISIICCFLTITFGYCLFIFIKNRKRLPVYTYNLKTNEITISKCHPKIIETLNTYTSTSPQRIVRNKILILSQKHFNELYPEEEMQAYKFNLKNNDFKLDNEYYCTLDTIVTHIMNYDVFISYKLKNAENITFPISRLMLFYLLISKYKIFEDKLSFLWLIGIECACIFTTSIFILFCILLIMPIFT